MSGEENLVDGRSSSTLWIRRFVLEDLCLRNGRIVLRDKRSYVQYFYASSTWSYAPKLVVSYAARAVRLLRARLRLIEILRPALAAETETPRDLDLLAESLLFSLGVCGARVERNRGLT